MVCVPFSGPGASVPPSEQAASGPHAIAQRINMILFVNRMTLLVYFTP